MIHITRIDGIEHVTGRLSHCPELVERATVSALNKIGAQGITQTKRAITKKYNIKQKDLKGSLVLHRAARGTKSREGRHFARIAATGSSIPLYKFAARPVEPKPQAGVAVKRRTPVTVKVMKQGGRKKVPHAFIGRMASGHVGVFTREGKASLPIRERYSVGVAKMFEKEGVKAAEAITRTKGRQIVQQELNYYTKHWGGKK